MAVSYTHLDVYKRQAEELAIFTANSSETAKNVVSGIQQRISNQKTAFEQYLPAEISKLDAAYVLEVSQGGEEYIILCIAENIEDVYKRQVILILLLVNQRRFGNCQKSILYWPPSFVLYRCSYLPIIWR